MLTIHHLGLSQSERIIWLCEELGVPYALKVYDRDPETRMAPPAYKALHPLGTAPIITDGDLTLPESGAIVEYIIGKYGNGRLSVRPDQPNFADYVFWLHFVNGSLLPSQMFGLVTMMLGANTDDNPVMASLNQRCDNGLNLIEARLGKAPFLAGLDLTAADIMMVFALTTMRLFLPRDITTYPNIKAYLQRIAERPAYRRAMAKGDPNLTPHTS